MTVLIQKHRVHAVWKFYAESDRAYLGQILGSQKEDMPALATAIARVLRGEDVAGYETTTADNGRIEITLSGQRAGAFEKEFTTIADAIDNQ